MVPAVSQGTRPAGVTGADPDRRYRPRFQAAVRLYENTTSLQDRTIGTGILTTELARQFAAGGFVGRASGREFDARKLPGYPPYDALSFAVPVLTEGDVNSRVWIRIREVEQSLGLLGQLLDGSRLARRGALPPNAAGEGLALVEGFRAMCSAGSARANGRIEHCRLRDRHGSMAAARSRHDGNIVADFAVQQILQLFLLGA